MNYPHVHQAIAKLRKRAEVCALELKKLEVEVVTKDPVTNNPVARRYNELYQHTLECLNAAIAELEKMEELTK